MYKFLVLIFYFLLFCTACTYSPSNPSNLSLKPESLPRIEILSWSPIPSTVILLSSKDIKLEEYALRQRNTKKIEILKNIFVRSNEPTTISVAKGFLNKKENELVLVKFLEVDRKKDF